MRTSPQLEVFADIWCPFAHVGLRVVRDEARHRGSDDVHLRVRAWPLEVVNGRALDPDTMSHHVEALRRQVAPDLFRGFDPSRFPTSSLEALALAARADRVSTEAGERVQFGLRDALFEQGLDISDPSVLADLAAQLDVPPVEPADRDRVLADWEEGRRRGVQGSPHFFCRGVDAFCPSLDIDRSGPGGPDITLDRRGLDDFLSRCFVRPGTSTAS